MHRVFLNLVGNMRFGWSSMLAFALAPAMPTQGHDYVSRSGYRTYMHGTMMVSHYDVAWL